MKKISAILAMVFILVMTVMPVSAAELTGVALTADAETVEIGTEIIITVACTPDTIGVLGADLLIGYDPALVEYVECDIDASDVEGEGIYFGAYAKTSDPLYGELGNVTFKAIANGKANFTVALQDEYSAVTDTDKVKHNSDLTMTGVSVQIGGSEPDPVFTVSDAAYSNGTFTVKVANIPENTKGTVYAAIFDGDDVLKAAGEATLTEGTVTINNVTATGSNLTAKIFVWNDIMIPLWDVIPVTVQ